ncbi:MyfA/PsaA family fimbrial adhesin [Yersinia similis]|uniref:Adhesin n=1 Tax=Yersinia similis TaxID=367190 RepID=A0A0T9P132_9GAMM|nr:MyfA/PsaA family fimbrial adhesin [Yersinia similis]CNE13431.1 adhesin [Yersinia similis]CNF28190.1 adhesin [Yersinia similis]CNH40327.1 adhesin [Yersinia similis]
MKMKCFAKNALAVATLMIAACGMANASIVINSKDVSAERTVKQGDSFHVEFAPSTGDILAGQQHGDVTIFTLTMGDTAPHGGWRLIPTGDSKGGYMVSTDGETVGLYSYNMSWVGVDNNWYINDSSTDDINDHLYVKSGTVLKPTIYTFTGRVEEYVF